MGGPGSCIWTLDPQHVVLFWEVVEPFGHGAYLEDLGPWGQALKVHSLALCLPSFSHEPSMVSKPTAQVELLQPPHLPCMITEPSTTVSQGNPLLPDAALVGVWLQPGEKVSDISKLVTFLPQHQKVSSCSGTSWNKKRPCTGSAPLGYSRHFIFCLLTGDDSCMII